MYRRILVGFFFLGSINAQAALLTFDNTGVLEYSTTSGTVYSLPEIHGLHFTNFDIHRANDIETGFKNTIVSGTKVGFNDYGQLATITRSPGYTFLFLSAWLGGAWNDDLNIQIKGYVGGIETYSELVTVSSKYASFHEFNWNVDSVTFGSYGGTPAGYSFGSGNHFTIDDITYFVAAIPEPSSYALLGLGLATIGFAARYNRKYGN